MIRIWTMFLCLERWHYNKALLLWLAMITHWGMHHPGLYQMVQSNLALFDEYPVENAHSIISRTSEISRSRSREIPVYPRNPAKLTKTREIPRNSLEILPNTCRYNIFETYLGYWSCLLAVNLQIYLEISSLPRVNIVPKLPGVLRLMLRKPGDW